MAKRLSNKEKIREAKRLKRKFNMSHLYEESVRAVSKNTARIEAGLTWAADIRGKKHIKHNDGGGMQ